VFYVGTHNKAYYKKHNLKESQLVYAPHAIDNERFSDPTGDKSNEVLKWREKLGIKKEDFVLLFAGKFEPRKNPMFLVELMQEFQSESIKLLLVGNGPLEKKLKSKFAKDDRVIFLDFQNQSDMPLIYRTSQLFILPSISETWGLALNEAMACGIPVLASAKCGAAIDIVDASSGLVFEPNDIEKVAGYIQDLENNLVIYTNLCLGAMAKSNQFKYSNIITAVKNVLKPSGSENNTFS
jgi:glycosyltransferase involved in cell wall biosynthesis